MRWFALAIATILAVTGCAPSASSSTNVNPAEKPTQASTGSSSSERPASSAVDGIRLTVDGQTVDLPGEVKVSRERISGVGQLTIGKNARPSALIGGNGVLLELQTVPGKDGFAEGFSAGDVSVATFTVWKGVEFSYVSMGSIPGRPIKGLVLSQVSGKLAGSFETDLNGTLGKLRARVDFGVVLPK